MEDLRGDLLAKVLSHTSPVDACRLSLVSSDFESAAKYDLVWESFLPSDYQQIITQAAEDGGFLSRFSSTKQLYLHLCDHPLLIDGGKKSFSLDKKTGKKCYMLAARDLGITWGHASEYWRWCSSPNSRFEEVAELIRVCWFEIYGGIHTSMLSLDTLYVAFIVFKLTRDTYGFENQPIEVSIGVYGLDRQAQTVVLTYQNRNQNQNRNELLNPGLNGNEPRLRKDGWMEIQLGEYFIKEGGEGELHMRMTEVEDLQWKKGIVIQGIEIRPKSS